MSNDYVEIFAVIMIGSFLLLGFFTYFIGMSGLNSLNALDADLRKREEHTRPAHHLGVVAGLVFLLFGALLLAALLFSN